MRIHPNAREAASGGGAHAPSCQPIRGEKPRPLPPVGVILRAVTPVPSTPEFFRSRFAAACLLLPLAFARAQPQEVPARTTLETPSSDYFPRVWTVDEGLPNIAVSRIIQDRQGYLWIATGGGLVRFDGNRFKEFRVPEEFSANNHNIRDIAEDASGGLVILPGNGGVVRLKDGVFGWHPANDAVPFENVSRLFMEPTGALWIDTSQQEVFRWNEADRKRFPRGETLPATRGRFHFAVDPAGQLWMGGSEFLGRYLDGRFVPWPEVMGTNVVIASSRAGGVWLWSSDALKKWEDGKFVLKNAGPEWVALARHSVQFMLEDREGHLWIGTRRKGLFCLSDDKLQAVPTPGTSITALLEDREGNLWVGTSNGMTMLRRKAFVTLDTETSQADSLRTSICDDEKGALWWANRTNGLGRSFEGRREHFGIPGDRNGRHFVFLICPDGRGRIWAATSTGVFTIPVESPKTLTLASPLRDVRVLFSSRNGDVWVCLGEYQLGYFRDGVYQSCETDEAFKKENVRAIAEDAAGSIWVATSERNLYQFIDGKFVLRHPGKGTPGGGVNGLLIDRKGSFWMTTSQGLVLRRGAAATAFGNAQGLSDEVVSQLVMDDKDRLWFMNRRGLGSVAIDDLEAVADGKRPRVSESTLDKADGMPRVFALTVRAPVAWKARDGRLWFSMLQGFAGVDPAQSIPARTPPPLYIDEVEVDRRAVDPGAPLALGAGNHQITFRFSAINFRAPEKVRIRHRLEGFDADWRETGSDRSATYAQLRPGSYRMRVAARNENESWNEIVAPFAITIAPAWWRTWWFTAAAAAALALLFGGLVRYWSQRRLRARLEKLEREHQLERERARIARDLHDELGYSVTQIGLIADRLKGESTLADLRGGLGELASCTRRLSGELEGVVWTVSPKNNQWNRLASYIRQFALSFFADTPIACTVDGVDGAPSASLAPEVQHHLLAILKEALNNTLKHARATRVSITLAFDARRMTLRIVDDGAGFDPVAMENSERNGLTNLRVRAGEIGGKIEIISSPGTGAEIRLSVALDAQVASHDAPQ